MNHGKRNLKFCVCGVLSPTKKVSIKPVCTAMDCVFYLCRHQPRLSVTTLHSAQGHAGYVLGLHVARCVTASASVRDRWRKPRVSSRRRRRQDQGTPRRECPRHIYQLVISVHMMPRSQGQGLDGCTWHEKSSPDKGHDDDDDFCGWPTLSQVARSSSLSSSSFSSFPLSSLSLSSSQRVPAGSPSRGGDVAVYVFDIKELSLPTPFCSVPVSISVFMALSTVFHSINSPDKSLFFPSYFCLTGPFNYISLYESLLQPWYNPFVVDWA